MVPMAQTVKWIWIDVFLGWSAFPRFGMVVSCGPNWGAQPHEGNLGLVSCSNTEKGEEVKPQVSIIFYWLMINWNTSSNFTFFFVWLKFHLERIREAPLPWPCSTCCDVWSAWIHGCPADGRDWQDITWIPQLNIWLHRYTKQVGR